MTVKKRKSPTSQLKAITNRKNALKSTGPRSLSGKTRSRWNCLQHGLLAKSSVIELGYKKEDSANLMHLLEHLRSDYTPVGTIEEVLIERIATCYWRLNRCHKAEIGDILQLSGSSWDDRKTKREIEFANEFQECIQNQGSPIWVMKLSSYGLNRVVAEFAQARSDIATYSKILPEHEASFKTIFKGTEVIEKLSTASRLTKKQKLKFIDEVMETFKDNANKKVGSEGLSDYAFRESAQVPRELSAELLLRYETAIEKRLYRAVHELERLQRIRLGLLCN